MPTNNPTVPTNNSTPYEILAPAATVWVSAYGEAFPLIDAAVDDDPLTGVWRKLGSLGPLNYDDSGVKVDQPQEVLAWRSLGDTGVRKVFRQSEDQTISLNVVDLTLEQYRLIMNDNSITTVPPGGEAGYKKLGLSRGLNIATYGLLVRFPSPYMADGYAQYEIPLVQQTGKPSVVLARKAPAMLNVEFMTLVDPNAASDAERFGRLVCMTDIAIS